MCSLTHTEAYSLASREYVLRSVLRECLEHLDSINDKPAMLILRIHAALDNRALPIEEDVNRQPLDQQIRALLQSLDTVSPDGAKAQPDRLA